MWHADVLPLSHHSLLFGSLEFVLQTFVVGGGVQSIPEHAWFVTKEKGGATFISTHSYKCNIVLSDDHGSLSCCDSLDPIKG